MKKMQQLKKLWYGQIIVDSSPVLQLGGAERNQRDFNIHNFSLG